MARLSRNLQIKDRFYHVMVQGVGKEHVFYDDKTKGFYLKCLQASKEFSKAKIISFCVMGNHAHVLVEAKSLEELSKLFHRANSDYARYYNRVLNRIGHVFRDRFKSEAITNFDYLINCIAYIHNNPLKAGLVKNSEDYKFSSLPNYLSGQAGIVDFDEARQHFDISPNSMREIMFDNTQMRWMEHCDDNEDIYEVLGEIVNRRQISVMDLRTLPKHEICNIAQELKERSGHAYRDIAVVIGVGRETLRKALLKID